MFDILHKVGIRSSTQDVYRAPTTLQGLAGWWTNDTRGSSDMGGVIEFHFGTRGYFKTKVLAFDPAKRVVWQSSKARKSGSAARSALTSAKTATRPRCSSSTKAGGSRASSCRNAAPNGRVFGMSLKGLVETGKGAPFPDDGRISVTWD